MKHQAMGLALATTAVLAGLTGCADLNDTGLMALATRVQAYALVDEQLLHGEMVLFPDHTGTVALRADPVVVGAPAETAIAPRPAGTALLTSCMGRLRYTATRLGSIDLHCNDGVAADLRMALIGETRGYGYGQTASGLASLTFGMHPVEARAHLTVPPGKQLVDRTESTGLELR